MKKAIWLFILLQAFDMLISGTIVSAIGIEAEANPVSAMTMGHLGLAGATIVKFLAVFATIACMCYVASQRERIGKFFVWIANLVMGFVVFQNTLLLMRLIFAIMPYMT